MYTSKPRIKALIPTPAPIPAFVPVDRPPALSVVCGGEGNCETIKVWGYSVPIR